jgi:hypothetical protein
MYLLALVTDTTDRPVMRPRAPTRAHARVGVTERWVGLVTTSWTAAGGHDQGANTGGGRATEEEARRCERLAALSEDEFEALLGQQIGTSTKKPPGPS